MQIVHLPLGAGARRRLPATDGFEGGAASGNEYAEGTCTRLFCCCGNNDDDDGDDDDAANAGEAA